MPATNWWQITLSSCGRENTCISLQPWQQPVACINDWWRPTTSPLISEFLCCSRRTRPTDTTSGVLLLLLLLLLVYRPSSLWAWQQVLAIRPIRLRRRQVRALFSGDRHVHSSYISVVTPLWAALGLTLASDRYRKYGLRFAESLHSACYWIAPWQSLSNARPRRASVTRRWANSGSDWSRNTKWMNEGMYVCICMYFVSKK